MELPAVWFIVMCFHLKLPQGEGERRAASNSPQQSICGAPAASACVCPAKKKCIKVKKNALEGNVLRWKENNQDSEAQWEDGNMKRAEWSGFRRQLVMPSYSDDRDLISWDNTLLRFLWSTFNLVHTTEPNTGLVIFRSFFVFIRSFQVKSMLPLWGILYWTEG